MMEFITDEEVKKKFVMACEDNVFVQAAVVRNSLSVREGSLNLFLYNFELNLIMLILGMYMATLTVFYKIEKLMTCTTFNYYIYWIYGSHLFFFADDFHLDAILKMFCLP